MAYTPQTLTITQDVTAANVKQIVDILTPRLYGSSTFNRKDSYTLKCNVDTGGDELHVLIYPSHSDIPIYAGNFTTTELTECFLDISGSVGLTKYWQVRFVGLLADFKLSGFAIDCEPRPEPVTFYNHVLAETGPNKKRIRVWPVTINTIGEDVIMTPYVDGVAQPTLTINSTYPKTFFYQFITDVFGIDHGYTLAGACAFELHKIHEPQGVQILPIAKRYDQVGADELFRYGKIKEFFVRILPIGGTVIPFSVIFQDDPVYTSTLTVVDGVEDTYKVSVPKTVAGEIVRIEFGPTAFDMHRYYVVVKFSRNGKDTELDYVTLK